MRDVAIIGVGAHPAGKFEDKRLKDLGREAVWKALGDAGVGAADIQVAYFGNSLGGLLTGQEGIRGQVVLQESGLGGIPVINVENACASGATALRGAWLEVASGSADMALAIGAEKMFVGDTAKSISALAADSEIELSRMGMQFSATYAIHPKTNLKGKMKEYGWTPADFAKVVVKNSHNGSLNPYAQHRKPLAEEDVLTSRMIADPLTLYMCSSIADGAAAAIVCPAEDAKRYTDKPPVRIGAAQEPVDTLRRDRGVTDRRCQKMRLDDVAADEHVFAALDPVEPIGADQPLAVVEVFHAGEIADLADRGHDQVAFDIEF